MSSSSQETAELLADRFPSRATSWKLRTQALDVAGPPLLMGIINVTPDSFSDGGRFFDPQAAIDQAARLVDDGAAILDIGGESTRPYSDPVSIDEELRRVMPVIEAVAGRFGGRFGNRGGVPVSIDTSKAEVARRAIAAGAEIINDVTGLEGDPAMLGVAVEAGAGVCAMHMRGTPQSMQDDPRYTDVVEDVHGYLLARRDALLAAGVDVASVCLDPGIGFGKTHAHNLSLMAGCSRFHDLRCPLLVGHSRKGFFGKLLGDKDRDRAAATAGAAVSLALQGVHVLRVHDVGVVHDALLSFESCGGYTAIS